MASLRIISGGQTGVDRAALDFALAHDLPYGGWCPRGGWAEDQPEPPGLLGLYPQLVETPSDRPGERTAWNVRDSHATLILIRGSGLDDSPGTAFTRHCAETVFQRPFLVADLDSSTAATAVRDWLARITREILVDEFQLNIAGPRESNAPGIHQQARQFLEELFA